MKTRMLFGIVTLSLLSVLLPLPRPAVAASSGMVISEVQLQSAISKTEEFVELYNASSNDIEVSNWKVVYLTATDTTSTPFLATLQGKVVSHGFVLLSKTGYLQNADVYFDKGLSEDGGHIVLLDAAGNEIDRLGWGMAAHPETTAAPSPDKGLSLRREARQDDLFADTDDNAADFVADMPDPQSGGLAPSDPEESSNMCKGVVLNEIMPNPSGADTAGGEFIELYNPADVPVPLADCNLKTDKMTTYGFGEAIINAHGFYVVALKDKLLNAGGTVTLTTADGDQSVLYPALDDNQAWALIDGTWQLTLQATPGAPNSLPAEAPSDTTAATATAASCPEGKYRNPVTNRCKNVAEASPVPCTAGQVRNPDTNRCHAIATLASNSSLSPCKAGQERNPGTNRCRSVAATTATLQPCAAGQERNPTTHRCRKLDSISNSTITNDSKKSTATPKDKINLGIIGLAGSGALAYGAYEYRSDLRNGVGRLRSKFIQRTSA